MCEGCDLTMEGVTLGLTCLPPSLGLKSEAMRGMHVLAGDMQGMVPNL